MPSPDLDDRELLRHLFAKATALLEDAVATALKGQGARVSQAGAVAYCRRLAVDLEALQALVAAIAVLSEARRRR